MAVASNAITSTEAGSIMAEFSKGGNFAVVHAKSGFVVDFDSAVRNRQKTAVEAWV